MLRTFDFAVKGAANKPAQGIALGGVGIARGGHGATAWRSARVSGPRGHAANAWRSARVSGPRRLARPSGLPRSSQTPVSEEFVLAKFTPKRRRPIGQAFGRGQETRAQRGSVGRRRGGCFVGTLAGASGYWPPNVGRASAPSSAGRQGARAAGLGLSASPSVVRRRGGCFIGTLAGASGYWPPNVGRASAPSSRGRKRARAAGLGLPAPPSRPFSDPLQAPKEKFW
jgi:hypothetical protein